MHLDPLASTQTSAVCVETQKFTSNPMSMQASASCLIITPSATQHHVSKVHSTAGMNLDQWLTRTLIACGLSDHPHQQLPHRGPSCWFRSLSCNVMTTQATSHLACHALFHADQLPCQAPTSCLHILPLVCERICTCILYSTAVATVVMEQFNQMLVVLVSSRCFAVMHACRSLTSWTRTRVAP